MDTLGNSGEFERVDSTAHIHIYGDGIKEYLDADPGDGDGDGA